MEGVSHNHLNGYRLLERVDGILAGRPLQFGLGYRGCGIAEQRPHALLGGITDGGQIVATLEGQHHLAVGQLEQLAGHETKAGRRDMVAAQRSRMAGGRIEARGDQHNVRIEAPRDGHHNGTECSDILGVAQRRIECPRP